MARKTQVIITDDITGELADETVVFGLDGVQYSIDLTSEHAAELRASLEKWVASAERVGGRRKAGTGATGLTEAQMIRQWAEKKGLPVSRRGRIPSEIRDAYYAEQG